MKQGILITLLLNFLLISCKKDTKTLGNNANNFTYNLNKVTVNPQKSLGNQEASDIRAGDGMLIRDSLFIGIPRISDSIFIKNIRDGGKNFVYFIQFNNIRSRINKKFSTWDYNKDKYTLRLNDHLTLELKRKKISKSDKNKDIQIMLYIKVKDIKTDSILFYKYQWDKNFPEEQRFETLSYLNSDLTLWQLETYTNQSEFAIAVSKWEKYRIDLNAGNIVLLETLDPY